MTLSQLGRAFWSEELTALDEQIRGAATIKMGQLAKMHPDDPKDPRWVVESEPLVGSEAPKRSSRRQRSEYACGCGITVRMFAEDHALSNPGCSICGQKFLA